MGTVVGTPAPMPQAQCEVTPPAGVGPGGQFIARTPDGQEVQVTVPPNATPGQAVLIDYTPLQAAQPVYAQPVLVGQPAYGDALGGGYGVYGDPYAGGLPGGVAMFSAEDELWMRKDRQAKEMGLIFWFSGFVLCCFCGPIGICLWWFPAVMHFMKPKAEKERLPQERQMALINLYTGNFCFVLMLGALIILASQKENGDPEGQT